MGVIKIEYIYAGMLLHNAKQPINEDNIKKVLSAAGVAVFPDRGARYGLLVVH